MTPAAGISKEKILQVMGLGLIVLGMALAVLVLGVWAPENGIFARGQIPDRMGRKAVELGLVSRAEEILYLYTDAFVSLEEGVCLLTDSGLVIYSKTETPKLRRVGYSEMEEVVWDESDRRADLSRFTIHLSGEDEEVVHFSLPKKGRIDGTFNAALFWRQRHAKKSPRTGFPIDAPAARRRLKTLIGRGVSHLLFTIRTTPIGFDRFFFEETTDPEGRRLYHYQEQFLYDVVYDKKFLADVVTPNPTFRYIAQFDSYFDPGDFRMIRSHMRIINEDKQISQDIRLDWLESDTYQLTVCQAELKDRKPVNLKKVVERRMGLEDEYLYYQLEDYNFSFLFYQDFLKSGRTLYTEKILLDSDPPYYSKDLFAQRLSGKREGRLEIHRTRNNRPESVLFVDENGRIDSMSKKDIEFTTEDVPASRIPKKFLDRWADSSRRYFIDGSTRAAAP